MVKTQIEEKFSEFYGKWMGQLEDFLQLLLVVSRSELSDDQAAAAACQALVNKLTTHHKEYYTFKWAAAHEDILAFFTPIWLSPLENAYLWITGWKPSMFFRLVAFLREAQTGGGGAGASASASAMRLSSLTEEQVKKIETLRVKIKMEEEKVEMEMERQHVAMADRKMVELVRLEREARRNGGGSSPATVVQVNGLVEVALTGRLAGLEKVLKMADCVRLKTLKGLLDILTPKQCVVFLASITMLQIQMSKWGKIREEKSCHHQEGCVPKIC